MSETPKCPSCGGVRIRISSVAWGREDGTVEASPFVASCESCDWEGDPVEAGVPDLNASGNDPGEDF